MVNKLKMQNNLQTQENIVDFDTHDKLFPEAISSSFGDFVRENVAFYQRHPQIENTTMAHPAQILPNNHGQPSTVAHTQTLFEEAVARAERGKDGNL